MNGFKVFGPDWTCRGFQYEIGKTYEEPHAPEACGRGFHFCRRAADCFNYYRFDPANKAAEVIAHGAIAEEGDKCATNKIEIVREIPWAELLGLVNTGQGNTGHHNSGDHNSGDHNSGDRNSGDHNSGDRNSGHHNSGYCNSGDCNSGHWNSGDHNSGDQNSGNRNSGHHNSGHYNSGNCNSGSCNSGHHNSGNWNRGGFSAGDFNTADHETGCFCTEAHKIRIFDQESEMTFREWRDSEAYKILCRIPFEPATWVRGSEMTDAEKAAHPDYEATEGYLKIRDISGCFCEWWSALSDREKETIKGIPNFDPEKFRLVTGIEV
jgi:hypothetical protein